MSGKIVILLIMGVGQLLALYAYLRCQYQLSKNTRLINSPHISAVDKIELQSATEILKQSTDESLGYACLIAAMLLLILITIE